MVRSTDNLSSNKNAAIRTKSHGSNKQLITPPSETLRLMQTYDAGIQMPQVGCGAVTQEADQPYMTDAVQTPGWIILHERCFRSTKTNDIDITRQSVRYQA